MVRRRLLGRRSLALGHRFGKIIKMVSCDRCAAGPGEPCITERGSVVPFHAARVERLWSRVDVVHRLSQGASR